MINEEMSPSELLSAFLDGELAEPETSSLFYSMAQSPELQTEMRQHLALRSSIQAMPLVVPSHLQDAIFLKGSAIAAAGAASAGTIAQSGLMSSAVWQSAITGIFKSRTLAMFFSGVLASTATFGLLQNTNSSPESSPASTQNVPLQSSVQRLQQLSPQIITRTIDASKEQLARAFQAGFKNGLATGKIREDNFTENLENDARNMMPALKNQSSDMVTIGPDAVQEAPKLNYRATSSPSGGFIFGSSTWQPAVPQIPPAFSAFMRGTAAYSFPHLAVPSSADPAFNNMSIGVQYRIGFNQEIGLEVGRESYQQQFTGTEDGKRYRYEQVFPALWAGFSYQRTLPKIASAYDLQPVLRATLGGTQVGPLAKVAAGLMYEYNDKIGVSASVEGTALAYSHQNTIFTTKKLGFTYGFLFRF